MTVFCLLLTSERYNIDQHQISVSGLSAGAFMAVQMQVAYSGLLNGVGVIAGGKDCESSSSYDKIVIFSKIELSYINITEYAKNRIKLVNDKHIPVPKQY